MRTLTLFCLFAFACTLPARSQVRQQENAKTGKTYAVIIGISDYGNGGVPHLQYADRDASAFAEYLSSPAGGQVPREQMRILLNDNATLLNVDQSLKWLVQQCNAGDKAYFYFSGHGDVENSFIFPSGFLLCYNAPLANYNIASLEVSRLNNFASTISRATGGQVILVTDACHSGILIGSENKGQALVGAELSKVKDREIRITSCSADEKSWEDASIGGGRGLFSYNLIKGLQGWADNEKDGKITVDEIKNFMRKALLKNEILEFNNTTQTPVVEGRPDYVLAKPDTATLNAARVEMVSSSMMSVRTVESGPPVITDPAKLEKNFFELLSKEGFEKLLKGTTMVTLNSDSFEKFLFAKMATTLKTIVEKENLQRYADYLHDADNEIAHHFFINNLASELDKVGETAINLYLKGDEETLQNRINENGAGMEPYPAFFAMARKLIGEENPAMNTILEVKQYYFAGLLARLQSYHSSNPASLQAEAWAWQQKALALEKYGAYIYNELGILNQLKKNMPAAEAAFRKAIEITPNWQLPWANLSVLYAATGRTDEGLKAVDSAMIRNPKSSVNLVNKAFLLEKKKDFLTAEEMYRAAIRINPEYYFPYERLGQLMITQGQFMRADSFFKESKLRQNNLTSFDTRFPAQATHRFEKNGSNSTSHVCELIGKDSLDHTVRLFHALELADAYPQRAYFAFRDLIEENPSDVLAWHYLGEHYFYQQQPDAAEYALKEAAGLYKGISSMDAFMDSIKLTAKTQGVKCYLEKLIQMGNYTEFENNLLLARLYDQWGQTEKAEQFYRLCIQTQPISVSAYLDLYKLYKVNNRFRESEDVLKLLYQVNREAAVGKLNRFYNEMITAEPENAEWGFAYAGFLYKEVIEQPGKYPVVNYWNRVEQKYIGAEDGAVSDFIDQKEIVITPRKKIISYYTSWLPVYGLDPLASSEIAFRLGNIYLQLLNWDSAQQYLDIAAKMNNKNAAALYKLAVTRSSNYFYTDALNGLEQLYKNNQLDFAGQLLLAEFRMRKGNTLGCDSLLSRIKGIRFTPDPALDILAADNAAASGQYKNAIDILLKLEKDYYKAFTYYKIARYAAFSKQNDMALQYLGKVKSMHTWWNSVLEKDPAWDGLRTNPGFKKWLKNDD